MCTRGFSYFWLFNFYSAIPSRSSGAASKSEPVSCFLLSDKIKFKILLGTLDLFFLSLLVVFTPCNAQDLYNPNNFAIKLYVIYFATQCPSYCTNK